MAEITEEQVGRIAAVLGEVSSQVNETSTMVTRFFAIVETMDGEGRVGLEAFFNQGLSVWDQLGLLDFQAEFTRLKIDAP